MKNFRFTISNKILAGFIGLILIFTGYGIYSIVILNNNDRVVNDASANVRPSADVLKDFILLATRSKMLITNWVYLGNSSSNNEDKEALKKLHDSEYKELKKNIQSLTSFWKDENQQFKMDTAFIKMEALLEQQQVIMSTLVTFEDYEDALDKFTTEEAIESEVLPRTKELLALLQELVNEKQQESELADAEITANSNQLKNTAYFLIPGIILIGVLVSIFMARSITRPINYIKEIILKLGRGELPEDAEQRFGNDEIGEMALAVESLVNGLKSTSFFAEDIGQGKYDAEFTPLSNNDVLGNALINMRKNLKKVAEDDKRRNWATEGLAKFGEILRKNNDNLERLSDEIISNLIKYLNANQGGLYVINEHEDDSEEDYLTLLACYAWDKKKYLDQQIFVGDGLTGQAWLEKDTIYLTEVPDDYVTITSGLGEANPRSILIVPLKVNEDIFGVVEIASFNHFEPFEIEFVERIAESIASSISSGKITQRTQKLLEESTNMTEMMRAQEEEMRQNMEELQATQEEMERSQRDTEDKERIITSTNMLIELDAGFNIANTNELVGNILGYESHDLSGRTFDQLVVSVEGLNTLKRGLDANDNWSGALELYNKQREKVAIYISAGKAYDMQSNAEKYLLFGADISNARASA